jgi:hypothetical protein
MEDEAAEAEVCPAVLGAQRRTEKELSSSITRRDVVGGAGMGLQQRLEHP